MTSGWCELLWCSDPDAVAVTDVGPIPGQLAGLWAACAGCAAELAQLDPTPYLKLLEAACQT